jgi:hypothetical protein
VPAQRIGEHEQAQKAAERGEPNEHKAQPAGSVRSGLLEEHGYGGLDDRRSQMPLLRATPGTPQGHRGLVYISLGHSGSQSGNLPIEISLLNEGRFLVRNGGRLAWRAPLPYKPRDF